MITGTKEYLTDICKTHKCPEHKNPLNVAWQGVARACPTGQYFHGIQITEEIVKAGGFYNIKCGAGHFPLEVIRTPTLTEELKQGQLGEGEEAFRVQQGAERRLSRREGEKRPAELGLMPLTDIGTGKQLTSSEIAQAIHYAHRCELVIPLGHVVLYHGKPYPTIDGYLYHAHRTNVPFKMMSRPLNQEEKKDYQVGELDYAWKCTIYKGATQAEFSGIGIITEAERTGKSKHDSEKYAAPVVNAKPWQMAQKRAEWQALRRAFPLGGEETPSDAGTQYE